MNVNNDLLTFTKQKFHAITNITQFVKFEQDIFSLIQIINIPFIHLQFGIFKCYRQNTYTILSKDIHELSYSMSTHLNVYESYDELIRYFIQTFLQDRYITEDVFRCLLTDDIEGLRRCIEKLVK